MTLVKALTCSPHKANQSNGIVHTFGKSWEAPINDCPTAETPTGVACIECSKEIAEKDQGVCTFYAGSSTPPYVLIDGIPYVVYHLRCFLRMSLGPDLSDMVLVMMKPNLERADETDASLPQEDRSSP